MAKPLDGSGHGVDISPPSAESINKTAHAKNQIRQVAYKINKKKRGSFDLFPKLPVEIRFLIWRLALPDGRRVPFGEALWRNNEVTWSKSLINYPKYTVLLQTTRESRQLTLEHYIIPFHNGPFGHQPERRSRPKRSRHAVGKKVTACTTCFDPARDVLCFQASSLVQNNHTYQWVKHLAKIHPHRMASVSQIEILDLYNALPPYNNLARSSNIPGHCFLQKVKKVIMAEGALRCLTNLDPINIILRELSNPSNSFLLQQFWPNNYSNNILIGTPEKRTKCKQELLRYFKMVNDDPKTKTQEKCKVPDIILKKHNGEIYDD